MGKSDAGAAPAASIPTTSTSARDPLHPSVSHSHHPARARGPSHHTAGPSSLVPLPLPTSGPSHTSNPHHPRTTTTITAMTDDLPHRWGSTSGSAAATPVTPAHSGDEEDTRGRIDARRSELSQLALVVCQQPERARLCSFKEENETIDRRPVDPPPVIELVSHAGDYPELLNSTSFFIRASLVSDKPAEGTAGHGTEYVAVKTPTGADATAGEVIQTPERLRHLDGKPGALCIFAKLSVRLPGTFRLKFTLYETGLEGITEITHTVSEPFEVFSPKLFKGMHESTPLTRHLATQGLKVKLRTDSSGGKAGASRRRVASAAAGRDPGTQMRYQAGPGGVASSAPPTGHHPHRSTLVWGGYDEEPARKMRRIDERDREAEMERARTRERERLRDDSTFAWGEMSSRLDISLPSSSADLSGYSLGHSRPNSRPQSASAAPSSYAHREWDNNGAHPIPRNREYPFGDDGMPVWPKDRPEMPPHDFRHEMPPPPEVRDGRDPRDVRDPREPRDPRDVRDPREFWDPRDPRDPREPRDPRDARDPRELGEPRDPREPRDIRDPREPWDPRDPRLARDPRDGRGPWDPQNGDGPLPPGPPQDRRGSQPVDRRDSLLSERRDSVSRDSLMREVRDLHSRDGSLAGRDIHSRDGLRDLHSRDGSMRDSPMRDVYSRDGLRDVRDVRSRDGRDIHSRDGIRDTHSRDGRGDVMRDPRDPRTEWSPAPHMHGQPHPLPQQQPPDFAFPQPRLPRIVPTAPPRDPRDPRDPVRGPHTAHAYPSHSQAYDYPHELHMPHSAPPHPHSHARRLSGPHPLGPPGPPPVHPAHAGPSGPPGSSGGHPQQPQHAQHPPPPPHHPHHPQHAQHAQHPHHPQHQAPPHGQHAPPMHYDPYARHVLPPIRSPPRQYERDPRG